MSYDGVSPVCHSCWARPDRAPMMVVVLAGGKGTRLEPLTVTVPKPLVPLGEVPILEIVLRQMQAAGVTRVVLALGHMAYFFTSFVERWKNSGMDVDTMVEPHPLGTAGPIALVDRLEDDFLVMNGDLLTTLDYRALFDTHTSSQSWGTIAVSRREMAVDYGVIRLNPAGELEEYSEKPIIRYEVSMGVYALSRRCVDFIPHGSRFDIPDLMRVMRDAGKKVMGYPTSCYWQDIGRPSDLHTAVADFTAAPQRFLPESTGD